MLRVRTSVVRKVQWLRQGSKRQWRSDSELPQPKQSIIFPNSRVAVQRCPQAVVAVDECGTDRPVEYYIPSTPILGTCTCCFCSCRASDRLDRWQNCFWRNIRYISLLLWFHGVCSLPR